jgi:hypothetical protein
MKISHIKRIFANHSNDIAFLMGNGINLHYKNDNLPWNKLLLELWDEYSIDKRTSIPDGISFTEFYDALEIQNSGNKYFGSVLQKNTQQKMLNWSPDNSQNLILNRIREIDAPILTTNFDDLIPKSMGLEFRKMKGKGFTDFYPWSCYYSDIDIDSPTEGFGIWYPNGMLKYHRSIKLGLSQYMGNVARARKMIHKNPEYIKVDDNSRKVWDGYPTWLHIIFNKSLFIFGLGLDETEVFIRWLLIERAKYFRKYPDHKHKGWYITKSSIDSPVSEGKKFFLNSVGIEVLEVTDYKTIYEDIWN